jgi:CRP-like cAMP-binding protein
MVKKSPLARAALSADLDADGADALPNTAESAEPPVADVPWSTRALALHARPCDDARGTALFAQRWRPGGHGLALDEQEVAGLARYMSFSELPVGAEVITQDERGDFLLVVLEGRIGVEQTLASGERTRLAEARAGDMLGEMSLLDAGLRSSTCTTRTPCVVAVLEARRLDDMMETEPRLALALLASLARRLSLRLRQSSARLSALLSGA